jgi:hypothetical protein
MDAKALGERRSLQAPYARRLTESWRSEGTESIKVYRQMMSSRLAGSGRASFSWHAPLL